MPVIPCPLPSPWPDCENHPRFSISLSDSSLPLIVEIWPDDLYSRSILLKVEEQLTMGQCCVSSQHHPDRLSCNFREWNGQGIESELRNLNGILVPVLMRQIPKHCFTFGVAGDHVAQPPLCLVPKGDIDKLDGFGGFALHLKHNTVNSTQAVCDLVGRSKLALIARQSQFNHVIDNRILPETIVTTAYNIRCERGTPWCCQKGIPNGSLRADNDLAEQAVQMQSAQ